MYVILVEHCGAGPTEHLYLNGEGEYFKFGLNPKCENAPIAFASKAEAEAKLEAVKKELEDDGEYDVEFSNLRVEYTDDLYQTQKELNYWR